MDPSRGMMNWEEIIAECDEIANLLQHDDPEVDQWKKIKANYYYAKQLKSARGMETELSHAREFIKTNRHRVILAELE